MIIQDFCVVFNVTRTMQIGIAYHFLSELHFEKEQIQIHQQWFLQRVHP